MTVIKCAELIAEEIAVLKMDVLSLAIQYDNQKRQKEKKKTHMLLY